MARTREKTRMTLPSTKGTCIEESKRQSCVASIDNDINTHIYVCIIYMYKYINNIYIYIYIYNCVCECILKCKKITKRINGKCVGENEVKKKIIKEVRKPDKVNLGK
jgi:hypothetical protein